MFDIINFGEYYERRNKNRKPNKNRKKQLRVAQPFILSKITKSFKNCLLAAQKLTTSLYKKIIPNSSLNSTVKV